MDIEESERVLDSTAVAGSQPQQTRYTPSSLVRRKQMQILNSVRSEVSGGQAILSEGADDCAQKMQEENINSAAPCKT
jgi:hypothetical protein